VNDRSRSKTVHVIDIADLLGVSHQRASKIVDAQDFPRPIDRQGQSRLWDRREATAWAKRWRREEPSR
jgi:predicted DNA-binding transcriptional regulator AlpA